MIRVELGKKSNVYSDLKPGDIFSWPISVPKEERAFGLKLSGGMAWIHDADKRSQFVLNGGSDLSDSLLVKFEGRIVII